MTSPVNPAPLLFSRRVLLGYGVAGTFLLPALLQSTMALAASAKHGKTPAGKPGNAPKPLVTRPPSAS